MKNLFYLFILSFLLISCEEEVPPVTYTLTTQVTPVGAGTVAPATGIFVEGSSVTISATPSENYSFKQWTGTGSGTANPLTFKIISNTTITAEFEFIDADNDGVTDAIDKCPDTPAGTAVNAEGCATSQIDSDGDGVTDDEDKCPDTPQGEQVLLNGCSITQNDADGDGVTDDKDQCPETPENTDVNEEGCPYLFLAENGVTIKAAPFASAEETYEIGGIDYLLVKDGSSLNKLIYDCLYDNDGQKNCKFVTSLVTDMSGLFVSTNDLMPVNEDFVLNTWDVSNVTNMSGMFAMAVFRTDDDIDLSNWDVSNVTNMEGMFYVANHRNPFEGFDGDISSWDVSNVTNMKGMFFGGIFNQDISSWDVSNVTNMAYMFATNAWIVQDLSSWNVDKCIECSEFNRDTPNWYTPEYPIPNFTNCDPN